MFQFPKKIARESLRWLNHLAFNTPGSLGMAIRERILRKKIKKLGSHIYIDVGLDITGYQNIEIGNNVCIMRNCSIHSHGGKTQIGDNFSMNSNSCMSAADGGEVRIGNNVMIAQNVVLRAADHSFESMDTPIGEQGHKGGRIIIGDGCWIAANVVVTRDVTIGENSIVGAGSVVTKDVEPFTIVGGVPARVIKKRL